ncbi:RNA 2'-phosphotransferase, partial [Halobium palmae]
MDPVKRCPNPDHGFFADATCPACERAGECVLNADRRERLSKFLSGALRHFPDDAGLTLDGAGWAGFDALVDAASEKYDWADELSVEGVVDADPKGRFERRDDRIRAAYGHSVNVDIDVDTESAADAPDRLYHGTA